MLLKQSFVMADKRKQDNITNQYNNLAIITLKLSRLLTTGFSVF